MSGRRPLALLAVCGGAFLVFLDTTIVNVSFPAIRDSFAGARASELVWILDAYFIAIAAFLVLGGGIADVLGRRRVFLAATLSFVVASLLCAVAPSWQALSGARVLQGIAGALMIPSSTALLLELYPIEHRARGAALWGAAAAAAAATGPVLGGVLVETAGWRWIFAVNLPLGALVVAATLAAVRESRDERAKGLPELLGSLLCAAALALVTVALVRGHEWGWTGTPTLVCFALAAGAGILAVLRARKHERPAVDPALFRSRALRLGNAGTLMLAGGYFMVLLANVLFLTSVWQYTALQAGLASAPAALMTAIVARPAGVLADRFGHRVVVVPGGLIYAGGALLLRGAPVTPDYLQHWLPPMLLLGIGIGLALPTLGAAAVADVRDDRFGMASAVNGAARQIGAVLGTAVLVSVLGDPVDVLTALRRFDTAYLYAAIAVVVAGLLGAPLGRPSRDRRPGTDGADVDREQLAV